MQAIETRHGRDHSRRNPAVGVGDRGRKAARFQRVDALAIAVALVLGCDGGPTLVIPGGALAGKEVVEPVADWSFVDDRFVDLETRPDDPYSVELDYILRDGQLYIDPSEGKRWLDYIREDARVRVRFDDRIYRATAVLVGEPGELPDFDPDRFIYRLDPR